MTFLHLYMNSVWNIIFFKKMKNIFLFLASVGVFFSFFSLSFAEANLETQPDEKNKIAIQIFVRETCQHCADEKVFLTKNNIPFETLEISENLEFYSSVTEKFNVMGPPLTLAGDTLFAGYSDNSFGEKIIEYYEKSNIQYSFDEALKNDEKIGIYGVKAPICTEDSTECLLPENPKFTIPFYGEVEIHTESSWLRYSSSFILGFLDGFNPCAMWVLIMFIIALMQVGDRTKMIFVAGTFLIAETIMYALILVLWWNFFGLFSAEYSLYLNIAVGILALGAGIFFIYEGFFTDGTCQVTNLEQQRSISEKISKIANSPVSWAAFGGILLLALSVNIIEFACSAGYPQVFTNILNSISGDISHKIGLLTTYMAAYMLDDVIIFGIALYSIEKLGVTQKYAKATNIFGGVMMILIGAWMIFGG